MAEAYAVPKRVVVATVTMDGGEPVPLTLFLSDRAERHEGHERPSDLLSSGLAFVPALDSNGALILIGRNAIATLSIPADEEPIPLMATTYRVQVTLRSGLSVEGTVDYAMPEASQRLQDYLNQSEPFIAIRRETTLLFVNKACITGVRALKP